MYDDPSLILVECYREMILTLTPALPAEVDGRVIGTSRMPRKLGPPRCCRMKCHAFAASEFYAALVARPVGIAMNHEWTD